MGSTSWECNVPAHTALTDETFLTKYNITLLDHPPYSPELELSDCYLFPKVKSSVKGTINLWQLKLWKKYWHAPWSRRSQKKTASTVSNNGKFELKSVGIEEVCILYSVYRITKYIKKRQYQNWLAKFSSGYFSVNYAQRSGSGRSGEVDDGQIKAIIDA